MLLTGCFTPGEERAEGWWSRPGPDRPRYPANPLLTWAARRPLAHDTLIHQFVRELLAQRAARPYGGDSLTSFFLGTALFERAPEPNPRMARCTNCNSPDLSYRYLLQLVSQGVLTPADTVFMHQQLRGSTEYWLTHSLLPGTQIVTMDTLWALTQRWKRNRVLRAEDVLRERHHTTYLFWISLPLFSRDRQTVVFDISYTCDALCGAGTGYVVRKHNNRWRIIRKRDLWVS